MKPLLWALIPSAWCLYRQNLDPQTHTRTHRHRGKTTWGLREQETLCKLRRGARGRSKAVSTLIWHFRPPELWENALLVLWATHSVVLCYGSTSKLYNGEAKIPGVKEGHGDEGLDGFHASCPHREESDQMLPFWAAMRWNGTAQGLWSQAAELQAPVSQEQAPQLLGKLSTPGSLHQLQMGLVPTPQG